MAINYGRYNFGKKKPNKKKCIYLYEKGLLIMIIQNMIIKIFDKSEMQSLKSVNQLINQALQPRNKIIHRI